MKKISWEGKTDPPSREGTAPPHTPPPRRLDTRAFGARTATFVFKNALQKKSIFTAQRYA